MFTHRPSPPIFSARHSCVPLTQPILFYREDRQMAGYDGKEATLAILIPTARKNSLIVSIVV
jgi:hypothetical protein